MIKKIIQSLTLLLLVFFTTIPFASAANLNDAFKGSDNVLNKSMENTYKTDQKIIPIIQIIIQVLFSLLGIIFLSLVVYGGYKYMTSGGNAEEAKKSLQIIKRAIIGLVIIIGAYAISKFILLAVSTNALK